MHWDGTVTLGNLLTICWFTLLAVAWWVRMNTLLREYPLHRHSGTEIFYPRGMRPEKTELWK